VGAQPEPYFNPDDPEDPGPDGLRLQMQRFEDSWRQHEVDEADADAQQGNLTPEEIAYHRALAENPTIQRLRAAVPRATTSTRRRSGRRPSASAVSWRP
jgi:hypothetical protein